MVKPRETLGQPVYRPRFEPMTFRIWKRIANQSAAILILEVCVSTILKWILDK
jgi:hypothetical protein